MKKVLSINEKIEIKDTESKARPVGSVECFDKDGKLVFKGKNMLTGYGRDYLYEFAASKAVGESDILGEGKVSLSNYRIGMVYFGNSSSLVNTESPTNEDVSLLYKDSDGNLTNNSDTGVSALQYVLKQNTDFSGGDSTEPVECGIINDNATRTLKITVLNLGLDIKNLQDNENSKINCIGLKLLDENNSNEKIFSFYNGKGENGLRLSIGGDNIYTIIYRVEF